MQQKDKQKSGNETQGQYKTRNMYLKYIFKLTLYEDHMTVCVEGPNVGYYNTPYVCYILIITDYGVENRENIPCLMGQKGWEPLTWSPNDLIYLKMVVQTDVRQKYWPTQIANIQL